MTRPPDELQIRRVRPGDADQLVSLVTSSFAEEFRLSHTSPEMVRSYVGADLAASGLLGSALLRLSGQVIEFWVAALGGEVVGCYILYGRSPLTIASVAVAEGYRRRGIGRRMMEHAFERARGLGRGRVVLEVLADNSPAVSMYRSLGMREYDRRESFTLSLHHRLVPPASPDLRLRPVRRSDAAIWPECLRAGTPPEASSLEDVYRSEYLPGALTRWLDQVMLFARLYRRTVVYEDRPVGFVCVRSSESQLFTEILPPLYLPEVSVLAADVISAATSIALGEGASLVRLYVSGVRAEASKAADVLGYSRERAWLYMYRDV